MIQPSVQPSSLRDFMLPQDEARAFGRLRRRIVGTLLRQALTHSRFRLSLVIVLTSLLWGGMFWMFADGFTFLQSAITHPEMHVRTIGGLFSMFFAALMLMLMFSSGLILYSSLYCSREVSFLLTTSARTERVFLYKLEEAIILSSWGFLLLGSPILLAYGIVESAPWYYYVMLPLFLIAFIHIPVALGAMICLGVVARAPDSRLMVMILSGLLIVGGGIWVVWSLLNGPQCDLLTPGWFQEVLNRLQFCEQRLLPSWWLSSGLLDAAAGQWADSLLFLTVMISNALFFRQLALWTATRVYRKSYSGLHGRSTHRRRPRHSRFDRLLAWAFQRLPPPIGLLTIKDLRMFRRDPMQWSQYLIFLSLLTIYFINIRRFTYDVPYIGWVNMISFLNLAVVGLLMSTFTTRFIFPMISLEGRRFWLLGTTPMCRDRILWGKFLFASGGSIIPCAFLVLLSDLTLGVSWLMIVCHQLTSIVLCLGLSGIAVGLGARLPSLHESSPSRIVAGFGGTLNLVISTLYILVMIVLTALPSHFYLATEYANLPSLSEQHSSINWWSTLGFIVGILGSIVVGTIATVVPLKIGFRAFRQMEF